MKKKVLCPACRGYHYDFEEGRFSDQFPPSLCKNCRGSGWVEIPMTNADRIRSMSDEELADRMEPICISSICEIVCGGKCNALPSLTKSASERCKEIILDWLQQPVEEDA